jgi:hypothetical protein
MRVRTFQVQTPLEALLVEQALAVARQLQRVADAAPDGRVLAQVEAAALPAGREFTRRAVEAALQAQAGAAEKKGRPAASAAAVPAASGPSAGPGATC